MRKYWAIARAGFLNSLVYRADTFIWGFTDLLDTLVFLFIWMVLFGEKQAIGGFSLSETITYLIGVGMIVHILFTHIGHEIEKDVQTGNLSNIMLKPVSYSLTRGAMGVGEKPLTGVLRLIVYILVGFFFREKFILNQSILAYLWFLLSIIFAYLINFLTEFLFGCLAFWTTTTRGPMGVLRVIRSIFSGGYAPLSFFPLLFQTVASFLPFAYTSYFPMLIYLGKLNTIEMIKGLLIQVFWVGILMILAREIWRVSLKRYEGVGI